MAKKHSSKQNKKKDSHSSYLWVLIVVLVLGIAISSVFFIDFNTTSEQSYEVYNHYAFKQVGDKWSTEVVYNNELFEVPSYYHPLEVEDLPVDSQVVNFIMNVAHAGFIIAVDDGGSEHVISAINLARILGEKYYGFPVKSALYGDNNKTITNVENTTISYANCADATEVVPVIRISLNESFPVVTTDADNPNCIIVGGSTAQETIKASDALVFRLLGIIRK